MTDTPEAAAARKKLADERTAREASGKATREAMSAAKPTPTQEENDLAASGVPVTEHEDDGSGPDPAGAQSKVSEANKSPQQRGGYATRTAQPARHE